MLVLLGLLVGFVASIPPGPINIFSLSHALRFGFWKSVSIRLTVSALVASYCYVCTVLTSLLSFLLKRGALVLRLAGSIVMVTAGLYLLRQSQAHSLRDLDLSRRPPGRGRPAALTFMLYVSSPSLPAFWLAVATVFTSHGLVTHHGLQPVLLALSCGTGSLLYYMIAAKLGSKLLAVIKPEFFDRLYRIMGIALFAIAAFTLILFFVQLL